MTIMNKDNLEEKSILPETIKPTAEQIPPAPITPEQPPKTMETEKAIETDTSAGEQKYSQSTEKNKPKLRLPIFRKSAPPLPKVRDEITVKIEKIMSEDLLDVYQNLSPIARQEFKIKGEETASKIQELLQSTHVKVKKIFQLIVEWLKLLPGINRFFLEQEAKIKVDKILMLKNKK
ncbi:MAG: hypothetical protein WCX97_01695 [Candidatus Magasanikbacteria bacterium]